VAATRLVIFDCDGVLIDSEPLAMRVLLEGLAEAGYEIGEAAAYERFLGRSVATLQSVLRTEAGIELSQDRLDRMRQRLFDVYRRELQPMPGIPGVLDALTIPYCVASSSMLDRLNLSLEVTGLLPRFSPHLFSATMVAQGKPAPDLFLHAAERMGVAPAACLVIEDSAPGIEAAQRAGMRVFGFLGGGHARRPGYRDNLAALAPEVLFDDMRQLPGLIGSGRPSAGAPAGADKRPGTEAQG
jgi:HAD superfamily hydrolase (TIGR01509 family)